MSTVPQNLEAIENMVWIAGGTFRMGSEEFYPEERPVHIVAVSGFWMDRYDVTNEQFARFVEATGYVTVAERAPDPAEYPEADPSLLEDAMAQRVLIATPTTLLALLHAVAYGWQQERVAESAQAVSELGRDLYTRIVKLSSLLATLGTRLNSTVKAYNETVGSYEHRVIPAAKRFEDHGAVASGRDMPEIEQVTVTARSVDSAESDSVEEAEIEQLAARRLRAG